MTDDWQMGCKAYASEQYPQWGKLRYENAAFLASSKRIYAYVEKE